MADSGPRPAPASAKCVKLRVIHQQSSEGVGALQYDGLPVSTSLRELKAKIHDSLPTHPPIDSQRLIYRGRVMATETAPLEEILGGESIRPNDTYTFHLVVRDTNPTIDHTSTPNQQQNVPGMQGPQPRSALPPSVIAQNIFSQLQPRSVPPGPNQIHLSPLNQPGAAGAAQARANLLGGQQNTPMPPFVPQMQNTGPQVLHQSPFLPPQAVHHGHNAAPPPFPMPMIPPEIAQAHQQMQQQVAAAMQQFIPPPFGPNGQFQRNQTQDQHPATPQTGTHTTTNSDSATDQQTQTSTREIPSSGSRMSMRVNNYTTPLNPQSQTQSSLDPNSTTQQRTEQSSNPTQPQTSTQSNNPFAAFPSPQPPQIWNAAHFIGPQPQNDRRFLLPTATTSIAVRAMRAYQEDLERLGRDVRGRSAMNAGPNEGLMFSMALRGMVRHRNVVQESVNHILAAGRDVTGQSLQPAEVAELERLSEQFAIQHASITRTINHMSQRTPAGSGSQESPSAQIVSEQEPLQATPQAALASTSQSPSVPAQAAENIIAYLVFSPSGPHSIVYAPQGTYATTPQPPVLASNPLSSQSGHFPSFAPANPSLLARQNLPHPQPNNVLFQQDAASGPQAQPQPAGRADAAAQQQQQQQPLNALPGQQPPLAELPNPNQQQEGDGLVVVAPLFRTLWLFIRLAGFIWLFTSGSVSYRSILLLALGAAIWAVQHGLFGNRFDGIQRYWENLIGVPRPEADQRAQPQAQAQAQNQDQDQNRNQAQAQERGAAAQQDDTAPRRHRQADVPTPAQAAQRLLDERREQDRNWWRERVRPLERIVALFLASLYPGVGERRVAEIEQLRLEREAAERRALQEREQQGQNDEQQQGQNGELQGQSGQRPDRAELRETIGSSAQGGTGATAATSSSDASAALGSSSGVSLSGGAESARVVRRQNAEAESSSRRPAQREDEEAWEDMD